MKVAVVGSGPAGVAAAKGLVEGGVLVEMLDYGNEIDPHAEELAGRLRSGEYSADDLKTIKRAKASDGLLQSAAAMFASLRGKSSMLDLTEKARLGSLYTFADIEWGIPITGAPISRSLARGGLSNVWGASCYPLTKDDYKYWPVSEEAMSSHYKAAARMLSLMEPADDLQVRYPIYGLQTQYLPLNERASAVLDHWTKYRQSMLREGFLFGRSRLAVRTHETRSGHACQLCGLCLYGCPHDAIYRSDWTLKELMSDQNFRYLKPHLVRSFREDGNKVRLETYNRNESSGNSPHYDAVFLAAGTPSTMRIAAESQGYYDHEIQLLDNDLYLVPFMSFVGSESASSALPFTLNELVLHVVVCGHSLHIQFYCMSEAITDRFLPFLSFVPDPLRQLFRNTIDRCLLAFVYLPGSVSAQITASVRRGTPISTLAIEQIRSRESSGIVRKLLRLLWGKRNLLGMYPIGPGFRSTPKGPSGGHLAGALPMTERAGKLQSFPNGALSGTSRVYIVDGAAMPYLPAQNSTYTIMANAHRIGSLFAEKHRE